MLLHASIAIARTSAVFTAVAKTSDSLDSLEQALGHSPAAARHYLRLDWDQPSEFLSALSSHVERVGPPSFVLAWLHDMTLGPPLARAVSGKGTGCEFFQVLGSGAASPGNGAAALREEMQQQGRIAYHQVVLGFVQEAGGSRWLNDDEISAGVLQATALRRPVHTVGTTAG